MSHTTVGDCFVVHATVGTTAICLMPQLVTYNIFRFVMNCRWWRSDGLQTACRYTVGPVAIRKSVGLFLFVDADHSGSNVRLSIATSVLSTTSTFNSCRFQIYTFALLLNVYKNNSNILGHDDTFNIQLLNQDYRWGIVAYRNICTRNPIVAYRHLP